MPILNYTTTIKAEKTVGEIQAKLGRAGAQAVMTEYDPEGNVCALSFRLDHLGQLITFRMPARIDRIHAVLIRDDAVPRRLKTKDQAARVAWRIVKDWVEAQLALVEADQAVMVEVFLPYAQNPRSGQTLFQTLEQTQFKMLGHDPGAVG